MSNNIHSSHRWCYSFIVTLVLIAAWGNAANYDTVIMAGGSKYSSAEHSHEITSDGKSIISKITKLNTDPIFTEEEKASLPTAKKAFSVKLIEGPSTLISHNGNDGTDMYNSPRKLVISMDGREISPEEFKALTGKEYPECASLADATKIMKEINNIAIFTQD
jgi:hypothetical protein